MKRPPIYCEYKGTDCGNGACKIGHCVAEEAEESKRDAAHGARSRVREQTAEEVAAKRERKIISALARWHDKYYSRCLASREQIEKKRAQLEKLYPVADGRPSN